MPAMLRAARRYVHRQLHVESEQLADLNRRELVELCITVDVPRNGPKRDIIRRLIGFTIEYDMSLVAAVSRGHEFLVVDYSGVGSAKFKSEFYGIIKKDVDGRNDWVCQCAACVTEK